MKRVLFVMTAVVGICGISMGMDTPLQRENLEQIAMPVGLPVDDIAARRIAKEVANEYISSLKGNKQRKIVDAINEASERQFWREHGGQGNYKAYSSAVAQYVLKIIGKSRSAEMNCFKIVAKGIITGKVENNNQLKLEDFTRLGIHEMVLSKIDIW